MLPESVCGERRGEKEATPLTKAGSMEGGGGVGWLGMVKR